MLWRSTSATRATFPTARTSTTTNLQDAIVYGTDDPDAPELLPLLNAGQTVATKTRRATARRSRVNAAPTACGGAPQHFDLSRRARRRRRRNSLPAARGRQQRRSSSARSTAAAATPAPPIATTSSSCSTAARAPVDLTGWSLQYASSTGSGWDFNKQPLGGTIGAGRVLPDRARLRRRDGAALPPANISGQINMAAPAARSRWSTASTALTGNCPICDPRIDGLRRLRQRPTAAKARRPRRRRSNTTALFRKSGGAHRHRSQRQRLRRPARRTRAAPRRSSSSARTC